MLNWIVWNRTDYLYKKGLALNNLQLLIFLKTKTNKQTNNSQPKRDLSSYLLNNIFQIRNLSSSFLVVLTRWLRLFDKIILYVNYHYQLGDWITLAFMRHVFVNTFLLFLENHNNVWYIPYLEPLLSNIFFFVISLKHFIVKCFIGLYTMPEVVRKIIAFLLFLVRP